MFHLLNLLTPIHKSRLGDLAGRVLALSVEGGSNPDQVKSKIEKWFPPVKFSPIGVADVSRGDH